MKTAGQPLSLRQLERYTEMNQTLQPMADRSRLAIIADHPEALECNSAHIIQAALTRGNSVLAIAPGLPIGIAGSGPLRGASMSNLNTSGEKSATKKLISQPRNSSLEQTFADWHPDTILACSLDTLPMAFHAANRIRVSRVSCALFSNPAEPGTDTERRAGTWAQRRRINSCLRRCQSVIIADRSQVDELASIGITLPPDRIHVIPAPGADIIALAASELPGIANGLRFLAIAEVVDTTHRATLHRAAEILRERGHAVSLVLATPPDVTSYDNSPPTDNPSALIEVSHSAHDMTDEICIAHVFIELGAPNIYPASALSALAIGRPILARNFPALKNLLDERVNGILLPGSTPEQIVTGVESLLRRPDLLPSMGRASRSKAERYFNAEQISADILKLLQLR